MTLDKFDIEDLEYFHFKPHRQAAVRKAGWIIERLLHEISKNDKKVIIKLKKL